MNNHLWLEAVWDARKESAEECAAHAVELFRQLVSIDSTLQHWYQMIGTKGPKDAVQHPIDLTLDALREGFNKYRNRRDDNNEVIEVLGFYLRLWNGAKPGSVFINIHAGSYPSNFPTFPNNCTIELPDEGPTAERLLKVEKLRKIVEAVVDSFDPDMAWISSQAIKSTSYPREHRGHKVVGWLTYLSDRYGSLPVLPTEYEVERIGELGTLIIIQDIDRLTADNPAHVAAVRRLSEILKDAGKLSPTPRA